MNRRYMIVICPTFWIHRRLIYPTILRVVEKEVWIHPLTHPNSAKIRKGDTVPLL